MLAQKSTRRMIYALLTAALFLASCGANPPAAPTLDANAIGTTIVGTTIAQFSIQFTQTALAVPPTSTPAPTQTAGSLPTLELLPTSAVASPTGATALPTFSFSTAQVALPTATLTGPTVVAPVLGYDCNKAKLAGETVPDWTVVAAGASFEKVWQIQNIGSCTWSDGYVFAFRPDKSSARIKGYDIPIRRVDEFTRPNHSQSFIVDLVAPTKPGDYTGAWQLKSNDGTFFGPIFTVKIVVN
jgi:hypothetical protein